MRLPIYVTKEGKTKEEARVFALEQMKKAVAYYEMEWKDDCFNETYEGEWIWEWCYDDGMTWQQEWMRNVFNELVVRCKYAEAADYRRKYDTVKITSKESVIPSKQEVKEILV